MLKMGCVLLAFVFQVHFYYVAFCFGQIRESCTYTKLQIWPIHLSIEAGVAHHNCDWYLLDKRTVKKSLFRVNKIYPIKIFLMTYQYENREFLHEI